MINTESYKVEVTIKGLIQVNAESYEHAVKLVREAQRDMYDRVHFEKIEVHDVKLEIVT